MSEHLERAAAALRGSRVFQASATFGVPHEAWGDCSRMMLRAALRAYQDLREWTVEELEALPEGAVILTARNHLGVKVPEDGDGETFWEFGGWYALTEDLIGDSPIRLLFNPDDVKEN